MSHVVLLRGVNVGGHRAFRPAQLAAKLRHLGAVNIGAAGTFVVRRPTSRAQLRAEFERRLPFDTPIMICAGQDVAAVLSNNCFARIPARPDIVRFVSVLSRASRSAPKLPMQFPVRGPWMLKVLDCDRRFVFGVYRRHMKAIGYLGSLDRVFGSAATTRNWNTFTAIAKVLADGGHRS
jgi:uncharacterized protein (DUF1697 family)